MLLGDELGISHCIFLSSQCTTKVPAWRPWSNFFLLCDLCVVITSIFRCCRYRKFIWTANIVWIVKDKISISFINSKIDNQVFWIIYWHLLFLNVQNFLFDKDKVIEVESTSTSGNSTFCDEVRTDFFILTTKPICWTRKISVSLVICFIFSPSIACCRDTQQVEYLLSVTLPQKFLLTWQRFLVLVQDQSRSK